MRSRSWQCLRLEVAPAVVLVAVVASDCAAAPSRDADVLARCAAIPATRYVTGLIGNPDGMQTYYERSRCLQEAAVALRAPALCNGVRARHSWFFDGSAFSPEACRRLVARQVRHDVAATVKLQPPQRLQSIAVARDGNGRDFDVLVRTTGGDGIGMRLRLSLVTATGTESVAYDGMQPMGSTPEALRVLLRDAAVARALAAQPPGMPLRLRARLEKTMTSDSERAVYSHAPHWPRVSTSETIFDPSRLSWHPDPAG
jgi:hypothetical protein